MTPSCDLRHADLGALAQHPEVGGQRELEAAAERVAGDRGDDRLGQPGDDREGLLQRRPPATHLGVGQLGHLLDVGAGGEHPLAAVEHDRAHVVAVAGLDARPRAARPAAAPSMAFIFGRSSRIVPTPSSTSSRTNSPTASSSVCDLTRSPDPSLRGCSGTPTVSCTPSPPPIRCSDLPPGRRPRPAGGAAAARPERRPRQRPRALRRRARAARALAGRVLRRAARRGRPRGGGPLGRRGRPVARRGRGAVRRTTTTTTRCSRSTRPAWSTAELPDLPHGLVDLTGPTTTTRGGCCPRSSSPVLERELLLLPLRVRLEALVAAADAGQHLGRRSSPTTRSCSATSCSAHGEPQARRAATRRLVDRHAALHSAPGPGHDAGAAPRRAPRRPAEPRPAPAFRQDRPVTRPEHALRALARPPRPARRDLGRRGHQLRAVQRRRRGRRPVPVRRATASRRASRWRSRPYHVWHGYLPRRRSRPALRLPRRRPVRPGAGLRYNPSKLLLDPYARAVEGELGLDDAVFGSTPGRDRRLQDHRDSAPYVPRSVVVARRLPVGRRPRGRATPWADTVVYELHVQGLHRPPPGRPGAPARHVRRARAPGRGRAPASSSASRRSSCCRCTTSSASRTCCARADQLLGLQHGRLLRPARRLQLQRARAASRSGSSRRWCGRCTRPGIEVLLDVVYNHTAEGDEHGPTLSFRGIDNRGYYRARRSRPVALPRLHRLRQHPRRARRRTCCSWSWTRCATGSPRCTSTASASTSPPALARVVARRRPALGLLRRRAAGPGASAGQADRRAVGRRRRAATRSASSRRRGRSGTTSTATPSATLWRGPGRRAARPGLPAVRLLRPVPGRRPPAVRRRSTSSPRTTASRCAT